MRRPLILLALIWATFVVIFPFAAAGDTSFLHIGSHLIQLALLGPAALVAWRFRQAATTRAQRALGWILSVTVPLAFACVLAELVTAIARLAQDGWVNKDTADIWEHGTHFHIANITVPAMMLSMLTALVLVVTASVQGRRRLESVDHPL